MSTELEVETPSNASPPREAAATPVSSSLPPISKARDHDIHLKSEYILEHRHPCLTPIPERKPEDPSMEPNYQKPKQQQKQKQKQKQNRHKKNVKNSSKRGRDGDTLSDMKVCKQLMIGNECPFGEECKYSHDMKLMLSVREDDITTVESGCPHFNIKGMCPYGVSCRVGKHHLNLSTGENLTNDLEGGEEIIMVRNNVSYDILSSLRKNKYDFVCQRYRPGHKKQRPGDRNAEKAAAAKAKEKEEKEKLVQGGEEDVASKKSDDIEAVQTQPVPVDLSPLPKMKKLIDFRNKVYGKSSMMESIMCMHLFNNFLNIQHHVRTLCSRPSHNGGQPSLSAHHEEIRS
jgi:nitrite reductase/ring-hydroxylating ferredoxin subunit